MTFFSVEEIRRANELRGQHFFERGTMRFFASRVGYRAIPLAAGALFVTSEQQRGDEHPRLYTVRRAFPDGSVSTFGEFQAYRSRAAAWRAAEAAADELGRWSE